MSRVYHTGSDAVLRSRHELELRLLAKMEADAVPRIGTEIELFVTTPAGKPAPYAVLARVFARIAEAFENVELRTEAGNIVGLHIPGFGDVSLEPGGQVELAARPCRDLPELARVNLALRSALDRAAGEEGLAVTGRGFMPAFMEAGDMPRSRFAAYYRYCRHEIGGKAEDLIRTMKSVSSLQVNLEPMGKDAHEVYRALMLADLAVAFNRASPRQRRLAMTYDPYFREQTEPLFGALKAKDNEDLARRIVSRLLTIRVPFVPDKSEEGFASTLDVFGAPPTVGGLLARGQLTEEIFDNALSLQLAPPNLRRHGIFETRLHDSVDGVGELMAAARFYRNAAHNEAARKDLLKRFEKADPDLLRAAFNARATMPPRKLMDMKIGEGLTVADLAAEAAYLLKSSTVRGSSPRRIL